MGEKRGTSSLVLMGNRLSYFGNIPMSEMSETQYTMGGLDA